MIFLLLAMIAIGMACLAASLAPIRSILAMVHSGRLRRQWQALGALVLMFLVGYALFAGLLFLAPINSAAIVVTFILMSGGLFVLLVARLSLTTTSDIVRIATLEWDVIRDPLTGVYNRRYLEAKLAEEVATARSNNQPLATLIVDIDHFKHVNDVYGHAMGDVVLRHVCALLVNQTREIDTVVRYGGEEFVVLVPNSSAEDTGALGEKILQNIAQTPVALPNGSEIFLTASIGAATLSVDWAGNELLLAADEGLYAAKRGGRNQMRFGPVLPDPTVSAH